MKNIRNIYYRGKLDTCNYICSYCPFGRKSSLCDTGDDRQAFELFCDRISRFSTGLRIMIIPYGEALIHSYYQEGIISLAKLPHVEGISCQTNLSFSPQSFFSKVKEMNADISKIKFWASFHPEMETIDRFLEKVHFIFAQGMEICAGVVGNPDNKGIIKELREKLDRRVYLFINFMEGNKTPLKQDDVNFFNSIDPLFDLDRKNAVANPKICRGGHESVFVDSEGDVYACPRSKVRLGNLHTDTALIDSPCFKRGCDCYIAYSNLSHTSLDKIMGKGTLWRIPEKRRVEAMFFDIDGTLTNSEGDVPENYKGVIAAMAENIPLFLATALPEKFARKKLGKFFNYFEGGVFADGGHIRYNGVDEYTALPPLTGIDERECRIIAYTGNGIVYKYVIVTGSAEKSRLLTQKLEKDKKYRMIQENNLLMLVGENAGKKEGIERICSKLRFNKQHVVAVGNTMHDWPMLSAVGYPCAVIDADAELRKTAIYNINPDHLPLFFDVL